MENLSQVPPLLISRCGTCVFYDPGNDDLFHRVPDEMNAASALVLAAGLSSRMGEFKPLLPLRGKTLIENAVESVLLGGAETVVVVTGFRASEVEEVLLQYGSRIRFVRNPDYARTDMLHSIRLGVGALPGCGAFYLLPGDMPVVRQETFARLRSAWETAVQREKRRVCAVFPTLDGYRKHPPLIDAGMIREISAFHSDGGLRELWKKHESEIVDVPVDDGGVWVDLDTPDDYHRCRKTYDHK